MSLSSTQKTVLEPNANIDQTEFAKLNDKDKAKLAACFAAVDAHITDNSVIGIGSGSTIVYAVQRIEEKVRAGELKNIVCIPTSYQARELIIKAKLPLSDLTIHPSIDVTIDGADEVAEGTLDCIKGGGGCHVQEKITAFCSKKFILVADLTKLVDTLGTVWTRGVPIEVVPLAHAAIRNRMLALGGTGGLRMAVAKMGPVVSDNGNFIMDIHFGPLGTDNSPAELEKRIRMMPGVVDCGLFLGLAQAAYFGHADGRATVVAKL